ncbi:hypothetical protein EVS81_07820 [Leucobacter triazinivorans]|uniref:HK97 gp10 family phage protein n=1 Tax=Leucobacter triazinivorans TaxID=1784719 RepID=A0A4V0Z1K7_9MICO|nr:hypothetical protein EVS81_07820 [Leucobacter triazinivorans]
MLDVRKSPELQAVILLLKTAAAPVRKEMRAGARRELNATWKPTLQQFAKTAQQQKVIVRGARAKVGSDNFQMLAATSRRSLSGGLNPATQWHGAEFGANPKRVEVSIRGNRRTQIAGRNFGPRQQRGKVAFPAARKVGPRIVAAWVNGIVKGLARGNKNLETR